MFSKNPSILVSLNIIYLLKDIQPPWCYNPICQNLICEFKLLSVKEKKDILIKEQ